MCVLHEANANRYLLWFFVYLLLLFVVVLLLNMLIAMFSRSFDMMYDSMTIHVQTHFARAVVAWCASAPEPPPLTLLQLPYLLLSTLARPLGCLRSSCRPPPRQPPPDGEAPSSSPEAASSATADVTLELHLATASATASREAATAAASHDPSAPEKLVVTATTLRAASPSKAQAHGLASTRGLSLHLGNTPGTFSGMGLQPAVHWLLHGAAGGSGFVRREAPGSRLDLGDYAGTDVPSMVGMRNSWEIWKEKLTEESLARRVGDFVAKREDTLAQEERWRNKMMRRLGDKFDAVDTRLDGLNERFERLAAVCADIQESVRGARTPPHPNEE